MPRRDLAPCQGPVREVVQWAFAGCRLVDGRQLLEGFGTRAGDRHEQRVVARADDAPDDVDDAVTQHLEGRGSIRHVRPAAPAS